MNNTFDIKRFCLLVKRDLAENSKKYLMIFLAMFGFLAIVLTYSSYNFYKETSEIISTEDWTYLSYIQGVFTFCMILFLIFGCVNASWLMEPISSKTQKISYLMNPASSFEKYFLRWIIAVVAFIVLYIVAFLMADFVQWLICSVRFPQLNVRSIDFSGFIKIGDSGAYTIFSEWFLVFFALSFYFYMQSLFVLGSTFWSKNAFIKTFSAGLVIFLLYLLIGGGLISTIFPEGFNDFSRSLDHRMVSGDKTEDSGTGLIKAITVGFFFFAVLNWVIGYFRFKETEIAKRI